MPLSDFFPMILAAQKKEHEQYVQEMKVSAFTGWQFYSLLIGIFGGDREKNVMNYAEYTDTLGLLDENEKEELSLYKSIQRMKQKEEAAQAIQNAQNIIALDRKART